jgi:hypothetical protein
MNAAVEAPAGQSAFPCGMFRIVLSAGSYGADASVKLSSTSFHFIEFMVDMS